MAFGDVLRAKAREIAKKRLARLDKARQEERARIQARVTSALREKGASEDLIGAAQTACFPDSGSQFGEESLPKEQE